MIRLASALALLAVGCGGSASFGCTDPGYTRYGETYAQSNTDAKIEIWNHVPANDLLQVVTHELGHAMRVTWANGLDCSDGVCAHSADPADLMYPYVTTNLAITAHDIAAYGDREPTTWHIYVTSTSAGMAETVDDAMAAWMGAVGVGFTMIVGDCPSTNAQDHTICFSNVEEFAAE